MDVEAMIDELEDHGFDDASDERMLAVLNDAYWDACAREPWPFLEKTVVLSFDDDSGGTSDEWPTDFRAAFTMAVTTGNTISSASKVKRMRYDDWLEQYGATTASGIPLVWYTIGNTAYFYPTPSSDIKITMGYLQQPAALADATAETDIVIPVAFHRSVIVNGALFKLYAMEDDTDIAPTFETYYERGLQNMREYCWRKDYSTQDIVHPVDIDDLGLDVGWGYAGSVGTGL
jgi:hypothetical protein